MPMLILSEFCPNDCSFCFGGKKISRGNTNGQGFDPDSAGAIMELLERDGVNHVSLGGGEPTLCPDFTAICEMFLENGFLVTVLTGGTDNEKILRYLENTPEDRLVVSLNIPTRDEMNPERENRIEKTLEILGPRTVLSRTISSQEETFSGLAAMIEKYGCQRQIRISPAHPAPNGENRFISPADYPAVGKRICEAADELEKSNIKFLFDCGFTRCMFNDPPDGAEFTCQPAMDIFSDGTASYCWPLTESLRENISNAGGFIALKRKFVEKTAPFRRTGLFRKCLECQHMETGICAGGCLAHVTAAFSAEPGGSP